VYKESRLFDKLSDYQRLKEYLAPYSVTLIVMMKTTDG
jgi:hypothetical protein